MVLQPLELFFPFTVWGLTLVMTEYDVYRRQILTTKFDPGTVRGNRQNRKLGFPPT